MSKLLKLFTCIVFLLSFSHCSFFEQELPEKTYSEAREDLELVKLQSLLETVSIPGSYNVEAYVVGIWECPPNALCLVADGIKVAESKDAEVNEEGVHIPAIVPSQFQRNKLYLFSVEVSESDASYSTAEESMPNVRLLGYSTRTFMAN